MTTPGYAPIPTSPTSSDHRPVFLTPRPHPRIIGAAGVTAVAVVALFGFLVARTSAMTSADLRMSEVLNAWHTGAVGSFASAVYAVFGPVAAIVITALVSTVIWLASRNLRIGVTFGAVVAVTWLPSALVKVLVHRPRPDPSLLSHPFSTQPLDASYPSGHMVFVTAFVVALVLLTRGHRVRPLVILLGGALVLVVGFALVVDGVHYSSDVLASVVWSLGLTPLVLEVWNRVVVPRSYRRDRIQDSSSLG